MRFKQRRGTCGLAVVLCLAGCDAGSDVVVANLDRDATTEPGDGDGGATQLDGGSQGNGDGDSNTCAWADVTPKRVPATVWLVIEHSAVLFWAVTPRVAPWERLEATLLGPAGLIPKYEASLRVGAVFHGDDPSAASCPSLTALPPALHNAAQIRTLAQSLMSDPRSPLGAYALNHIASAPPPKDGERVVVMIKTGFGGEDGACVKDIPAGAGGTKYGVQMSYEAARALADAGTRLFVVEFSSWSEPTEDSATLATIGNTGYSPFLVPTDSGASDQGELDQVFQTILAESVSCEFQLNGKVETGHECDGEVSVDGQLRTCNDPDGFRMKDESTVEFVGKACKDLRAKASAQIKARFPCDAFVLF